MIGQYSLAIILGLGIGLSALFYELFLQPSFKHNRQIYESAQHVISRLNKLTQKSLKAISKKSLRRKKDSEEEEELCVICNKSMLLGTITSLACKHRYHRDCINEWFELIKMTKCPYGC